MQVIQLCLVSICKLQHTELIFSCRLPNIVILCGWCKKTYCSKSLLTVTSCRHPLSSYLLYGRVHGVCCVLRRGSLMHCWRSGDTLRRYVPDWWLSWMRLTHIVILHLSISVPWCPWWILIMKWRNIKYVFCCCCYCVHARMHTCVCVCLCLCVVWVCVHVHGHVRACFLCRPVLTWVHAISVIHILVFVWCSVFLRRWCIFLVSWLSYRNSLVVC